MLNELLKPPIILNDVLVYGHCVQVLRAEGPVSRSPAPSVVFLELVDEDVSNGGDDCGGVLEEDVSQCFVNNTDIVIEGALENCSFVNLFFPYF